MIILQLAKFRNVSWLDQARRAFSLPEMIVVISVIGILAGIIINSFGNMPEYARRAIAYDKMEDLNRRLHQRAVAYVLYANVPSDTNADEQILLYDMQNSWPGQPQAPYFDPTYAPVSSANINDYRMRWAGERLEMLEPGTPGNGLKIPFDGSDYGPARIYPPGATSSGK
jgi:prepilin-type N-terminal cleavage/methylation domain-containing protein